MVTKKAHGVAPEKKIIDKKSNFFFKYFCLIKMREDNNMIQFTNARQC